MNYEKALNKARSLVERIIKESYYHHSYCTDEEDAGYADEATMERYRDYCIMGGWAY